MNTLPLHQKVISVWHMVPSIGLQAEKVTIVSFQNMYVCMVLKCSMNKRLTMTKTGHKE